MRDFTYPALCIFFTILSLSVYHLMLRFIDTAMTRTNLEFKFRQKELENQSLSRMNQTRAEFLQDMRHELKTPLTLIATGIDYADQEIKAENGSLSKAGAALGTIRAETQRLGRMIDSMAGLNNLDEIGKNRKEIDFAAFLRQNAEKFRHTLERHGNVLTIKLAVNMPNVFIETDRLTQVVSNLLTNAAEHTKCGHVITEADYDDEYITVCISDTGEGIAPEILQKAFERGVSGCGSTGYGLYICKAIVEAHGGRIWIESGRGQGCAVTFTLPVRSGMVVGHN